MEKINKKIRKLLLSGCIGMAFTFHPSPLTCAAQDVELKRERVFTASGLYGFMNGGADQFLEYGVQKLTVRDVVYNNETYIVEVYEMPSATDAFGIYSLHTFKCQRADTLGCIDCLSPYQLQAVSGNKYISVVFPSGSHTAKDGVDQLLRQYVNMDTKENPDIPGDLLGIKPPYSGNLKYLKGPLSVSTANYSLAKMLEDISYSGIWFIPDKTSDKYKALIYLNESEEIGEVKKKLSATEIIKSNADYILISASNRSDEEDNSDDFGF